MRVRHRHFASVAFVQRPFARTAAADPGFMYKECPGSCGVCDGIKCADNNATQCQIWAEAGECLNNPLAVMKECPDSCGVRL